MQELRYFLFLCYGIKPPDLISYCDGCVVALSIFHTFDCNKGGLITAHHSDICGGVSDLAGKSLSPANMRDDPNIFTGRAVQGGRPKPNVKARRHRLWTRVKIRGVS